MVSRLFRFNPLPSQEGRLSSINWDCFRDDVSIHSLRKKGDSWEFRVVPAGQCFNPLPSQEGRPAVWKRRSSVNRFNPLPSQEGRRLDYIYIQKRMRRFNPLPSQEGRRSGWDYKISQEPFQSTPFARRETFFNTGLEMEAMFQSTPFARRETIRGREDGFTDGSFNPLPSQEGRRHLGPPFPLLGCVSIHSLRKKGDWKNWTILPWLLCFNPLPSQEGRQRRTSRHVGLSGVSIHSLRKKGDNRQSKEDS